MVLIVVLSPGPKRQKVMQAPREFITAMRINRLEKPTHNPDVHCQDMQVAGQCAPEYRRADGAETQDHDFNREAYSAAMPKGAEYWWWILWMFL